MQFIENGPDIPDMLLQAHEEGRVVFFCGAGISYPAGLPGFKGMVEEIYKLRSTIRSESEDAAFEREQFDSVLDLLERRLPGGRLAVRNSLAKSLASNINETKTQEALLELARCRDGSMRLVTTNFDRLFHEAAKKHKHHAFQSHIAPMLPIAKKSRWNGLVYLHGQIPENEDEAALNNLVVTSGDFGVAYLTERWAARFVSELFRNYVVCFIGYSLSDPVMRYMMDALAADRVRGEVTPQAWALGGCQPEQKKQASSDWKAKGVMPILYDVLIQNKGTDKEKQDHSLLHKTLHAWADTYRDGVGGKEAIVAKYALVDPQHSTQQDDFIRRMTWALSDKTGLPAKRFAEYNPVPSLDWLECFERACFGHNDLPRFGVASQDEDDAKLSFSLLCRPAPYNLTPRMQLASNRKAETQLDEVMKYLALWLTRHLNDPRLIFWIADHGGMLCDSWAREIEKNLNHFASQDSSQLNGIRLDAPNAVPDQYMRILWRLLISGRVKPLYQNYPSIYSWVNCLENEGLTTTLRLQLRELLKPMVKLNRLFNLNSDNSYSNDGRRKVDYEIVLAAGFVKSTLCECDSNYWKLSLPLLLDDFQQLLLDALAIEHELEQSDEHFDRSFWDLPSIENHWQNRGFRDWVCLIELLRDAWLSIYGSDPVRAERIAQHWFELPYPTFKRLALFAASYDHCIMSEQWVNWLLADNAWCLWSIETKREMFRLLSSKARSLHGCLHERLEAAILAEPSKAIFSEDIDNECWQKEKTHLVWLRLAKLQKFGFTLSKTAATRLEEISNANSQWKLASNESDEFSHWMSGTGDPDFDANQVVITAPRNRRALVEWLKQPPSKDSWFYIDTWKDVCRTRFFRSLYALDYLAREGVWPTERWDTALYIWSEKGCILRTWRYTAPIVKTMPDNEIQKMVSSVTWWMLAASESVDCHEDILLELCDRIIKLHIHDTNKNSEPTYDYMVVAKNHPIGRVADTLINLWLRKKPNDDDQLPDNLKDKFTQLCNVNIDEFRYGRFLLGSQLISFFRVDPSWTETNLLPRFDWGNSTEASNAWMGFLLSPRLYQPLMTMGTFKSQFLECAKHYDDLGELRHQYSAFLTYTAVSWIEGYTINDFRTTINELPEEALENSAKMIVQLLRSAGDQCEAFWINRVEPFWREIWPKNNNIATPRLAESLAQWVIAARNEFPAALELLRDWLKFIKDPDSVFYQLYNSGLCKKIPEDTLEFLSLVISGTSSEQPLIPDDLKLCLNDIMNTEPLLINDERYKKLSDYCNSR